MVSCHLKYNLGTGANKRPIVPGEFHHIALNWADVRNICFAVIKTFIFYFLVTFQM